MNELVELEMLSHYISTTYAAQQFLQKLEETAVLL